MPEGLPPDIIHIGSGTTLTYVVPREDDCILGGSSQVGDDDLQRVALWVIVLHAEAWRTLPTCENASSTP